MSLIANYVATLETLTGDPFEDEVCARLQGAILDFQTIPTKPHGDGGLDGISDDFTIGYCCYGPEYDSFKSDGELTTDIVNKFKSDMRRVLELHSKKDDLDPADESKTTVVGQTQNAKPKGGRSDLTHRPNKALVDIIPEGKKIELLTLVVNRLESNKIHKRLYEALQHYKQHSQLRFAVEALTFKIVGPKQLANQYGVDEITLNRARQREFAKRITLAVEHIELTDPKDFDHKISLLKTLRPDRIEQIDMLADQWRSGWRFALAFEQDLGDGAPGLHFALEQARQALLARVTLLMFESVQPWMEISKAQGIASELLRTSFEFVYADLFPRICDSEISRLIGECPIRWDALDA